MPPSANRQQQSDDQQRRSLRSSSHRAADLRARPRTTNTPPRNEPRALEMEWVDEIRINLSAAERRIAALPGRRTVKKDAQAAWLLKAITCIDLTTLNGDDTTETREAPLRQGEGAGARRHSRCAGLH